MEIYIWHIVRF